MTDDGNVNNVQALNTNDSDQQNTPEIDLIAQYDKAIDFLKKEMFLNSENCFLSIIPHVASNLSVESNQELFLKVMSRLILVIYINNSKTENPVNFLLTKIKSFNIPNLTANWELIINQMADDVVTDYYKCIRLLSVDFFVKLNPFKYFSSKAPKCDFRSVSIYVNITRQCSSKLSQTLIDDISFAFFKRLKTIFSNIENNDLRNIDEKRLQILMNDFRELNPSRDFNIKLDRFNTNIMFVFCQSSNLSKQYDGLLRFNEVRSLKPLLDRIVKSEILQNLLSNIHESIVMEFAKFLTHLFDVGYYNRDILVKFWNISLNQYVSVIDKFFAAWSCLFVSIPQVALSDFWSECVYKTKSFPLAALNFLCQVRSRAATQQIKSEVSATLWKAMDNLPQTSETGKIEYVNALFFYTTPNSNQWTEMKGKCFEYISKGQNVAFAVSLLSRIWCHIDSDTTEKEFDNLLYLGRNYNKSDLNSSNNSNNIVNINVNLASNLKQFENGNEINASSILYVKQFIHLLFDLIKNMANGLKSYFSEKEIDCMKPLLLIYLDTMPENYARRLIKDISSHISDQSTSDLIQWLCGLHNVDSKVFSLVQIFFNQLNDIKSALQIKVPLKNLTGIELIWNLLFSSNNLEIPNFLASLAVQCSDIESASYFIKKCMNNINNRGSILALNYFVWKIEISFDIDSLKIKRNMFEMPNTFITVELSGEINKTIKIRCNTTADHFISKIARLLHTIDSAVIVYYEQEKLRSNHSFKQDQHFTVQRNPLQIHAAPIRIWDVEKGELPSQLIQPYFSKIYELLDKDNSLSDDALVLLNYIPTNDEEKRKIEILVNKTNSENKPSFKYWEELLNVDHPYHTLYRLNIIGNLLISDNRVFEKAFFENGGFKRFLDILFSAGKAYKKITNINLILNITLILLDIGNKTSDLVEFKNQILADTGVKNLPELVTWISTLLRTQPNNNININNRYNSYAMSVHFADSLMKILIEIVRLNKNILPKLESFPELVSLTIFHENEKIRMSIQTAMEELNPIHYQKVLFDNIDKTIYGKCNEYFCLMQCVIKSSTDHLSVWNILSNFLITHLFIYKNKQSKKKKNQQQQSLENETENSSKNDDNNSKNETENNSKNDENSSKNENENISKNVDNNSKNNDDNSSDDDDEIYAEFENDQLSMIENTDDQQLRDDMNIDIADIKSRMKDLCSFVADSDFVKGVFYCLLVLICKIDQVPNAEEFVIFVIDRIVFNTQQYIPLPESCFALLCQIASQNPKTLLPIITEHLGKFHNIVIPSPLLPSLGPNNQKKGINNMGATCYLNSSLQQILKVKQIRDALFRYKLNNTNTTTNNNQQVETNEDSNKEEQNTTNNNQQIETNEDSNKEEQNNNNNQQIETNEDSNKEDQNNNNNQKVEINEDSNKEIQNNNNDSIMIRSKSQVISFEDDWVAQLQQVAAKLLYSPLVSIDASPFVKVWKGWDDEPIDPHDQQDAGEFVQMLLDRLDSKLEGKPVTASIVGQFEERVVQINGNFTKELLTDFIEFPVQVENLSNFQESFKRYLEPDNLTGNDKYSVEGLGLIDAERYHTIYKAPETLIILLKRFEFDLVTMSSKKINSYFEFTPTLDISTLLSDDANKDNCQYELTGIVMHSGCVIGGHYYSYIKEDDDDETGKWNCFNDSSVYPLEPNFMERCFGGKRMMTYYDQNKKRNVNEQVERTESAYLLFYKLIKRNKFDEIEPITLMPKNALCRFLTDIEQTIIRNMMMSIQYADFIGSLIDNCKCNSEIKIYDHFYEFLLNYVLKILSFPFEGSYQQAMMYESNSSFKYTQSIDSVCMRIKEKCKNDSNFSVYILNNSKEIINFLLLNGNEQMRIKLLEIVNSAISNSSKEISTNFINKIVKEFNDNDFINFWHNFDQIFGPVLYYLNNIDANRQDILDCMIKILEKSKLQGDEYLINVNLSSVFQIFLTIVTKLNKFKEYSAQVIDPQFIQSFSKSQKHLYDASLLVMNFQKDNQTITDNYLKSISSRNLSPIALASLFASSISLEDSLSSSRIQVFMSLIRMRSSNKWTTENVSQFFNETAKILNLRSNNNKYSTICKHFDWIVYLLHTDSNLRKSIVEFAHSIFKLENVSFLVDCLLSEIQSCIDRCLSCSSSTILKFDDCYPTPQFFDLLYWSINLGHFENCILKNKIIFVKAMSNLASLSSQFKRPIFDLIDFLKKTLSDKQIPSFFDNQTLSIFLKTLSNTPNDNKSYIESVMPLMCHFIINIPKVDRVMITKSNAFKLSLIYLLYETNNLMMNFFEKMLDKQTASIIASTVFDTSFLAQHKCIKYSINIMRIDNSTSELFLKSNCVQIIVNFLGKNYENRLSLNNYKTLEMYLKLLITFVKSYILMVKNNESKSFLSWFSNPISKFIDFWTNNKNFTTNLFLWTQMSSVPSTFSKSVFVLIETIYTSDPKFAPLAFEMLKHKQPDFLLKVDQSAVIDYLKMTFSFYKSYYQTNLKDVISNNYNDFSTLLKSDNSICNSHSVSFVAQTMKIEPNIPTEFHEKFTFMYSILFSKTNEIQMFNQNISSAAFQSAMNSTIASDAIQQWSASLLLLVSSSIKELNKNKENSIESIQIFLDDLKIAREFLEDAQGMGGIKVFFGDLKKEEFDSMIDKIKNDNDRDKSDLNIALYFEKFIPK